MSFELDKPKISKKIDGKKVEKIQKTNLDKDLKLSLEQKKHLKKRKFGLKQPHNTALHRFVRKIDNINKFVNSLAEPAILGLTFAQYSLNEYFKSNIITPQIVLVSQSIVFTVSDIFTVIKRSKGIYSSLRTKYKLNKLKKDFNCRVSSNEKYSWLNQKKIWELQKSSKEIIVQIDELNKIKETLLSQNLDFSHIDKALDSKQNELNHIREYISVINLKEINGRRANKKIFNIFKSCINITARLVTAFATILSFGSSTLLIISYATLITGKLINLLFVSIPKINQFFRDIAYRKRRELKAKNMIESIKNIDESKIDTDIVFQARLGISPFSMDLVRRISNLKIRALQDTNILSLSEEESSALSKINNSALSMQEANTIKKLVADIESAHLEISEDDKQLISNLKNNLDTYYSLHEKYTKETILLHDNMYKVTSGLKMVTSRYDRTHFITTPWYLKLFTNEPFSEKTIKNLFILDELSNKSGLSREFKNELMHKDDIKLNRIWRCFNIERSTKKVLKRNVKTVDFIINLVQQLPDENKLIKNGTEITLEQLNLDDETDRTLLNTAFNNMLQYEHAKNFVKACITGKDNNCSTKLISEIKDIKNKTDRSIIAENLLKEIEATDF